MTDRFDKMARAILTGETTSASAMKAVAAALRSVDAEARVEEHAENCNICRWIDNGKQDKDACKRRNELERALQPEAGAPGAQKEEDR